MRRQLITSTFGIAAPLPSAGSLPQHRLDTPPDSATLFQPFGKTLGAECRPEVASAHLRGPAMNLKRPDQKQPSPSETIGLGTLAAVVGFFLMLTALILQASPGRPNGLMWIALAVGFCLL